jgi:hypothetical protein
MNPDHLSRLLDCRLINVRSWHETDMTTALRDVRSQGQSGKHMLALSFSGFDPMYGPAARCKRFRQPGRCGPASMYPALANLAK